MKKFGKLALIATGAVIGLFAIVLMKTGNPGNMGFCIACFLRDIAGALGFDRAPVVQYLRPEIIGFILGAFILAVAKREFKPSGGSSPVIRFTLGFFMMIGALVFLGCPLRMILRLSAGDMNALVGLGGFVTGIAVGSYFLTKGFSLGQAQRLPAVNGFVLPAVAVIMLVFLLIQPTFIFFSQKGPGAMHAPVWLALAAGLIIGGMAQQSRMCMAGGIRDIFLIKNFDLAKGYIAIFVVALIGNIAIGNFKFGFADQPIAHTDFVWNFLGMSLVGFSAVLAGGCPFRQVVLAGEGSSDAAITVLGMVIGGAVAHNFGLAASSAGVGYKGQIAVVAGLLICLLIATTSKRVSKGARL